MHSVCVIRAVCLLALRARPTFLFFSLFVILSFCPPLLFVLLPMLCLLCILCRHQCWRHAGQPHHPPEARFRGRDQPRAEGHRRGRQHPTGEREREREIAPLQLLGFVYARVVRIYQVVFTGFIPGRHCCLSPETALNFAAMAWQG